MKNIIAANDVQFYPTPAYIAEKMLDGIQWRNINTVLEPSAGKGDLVKAVVKKSYDRICGHDGSVSVDCIEIDPYLREILKFEFSHESHKNDRKKLCDLEAKSYSDRTERETDDLLRLRKEIDIADSTNVHIIHDDFLTYSGFKHYDLIVMNPPFADGDKHLIRAIEVQQQSGGSIVCLLNAETLKNPYTNSRTLLAQLLDKYSAEISFVDNAFADAERKAKVDVAIIKINIPKPEVHSDIYERMKKAEEQKNTHHEECKELVIGDYIEQTVQRYNIEVAASIDLIRQYEALYPYMLTSLDNKDEFRQAILTLTVGTGSNCLQSVDINEYLRRVRLKYWDDLFGKKEFMGMLTSNLQNDYRSKIEKMADYDFTVYNIRALLADMNSNIIDGVKKTIIDLFDKLTVDHTWYPETSINRHYFNGWKTNKAHMIGSKSIIPTYGMFATYSWSGHTFNVSTAFNVISDIEKAFNYLDGGITNDIDLLDKLSVANKEGRTRNIECKYFKIDIFKKGTTHIKFTNMDLVEKLNIYAAKNKKWLPPNYGKSTYKDMTEEERAVVDDFQGENEYNRVLKMSGYFLAGPMQSVPLLSE